MAMAVDKHPAFVSWRKASVRKKVWFARQQLRDGIKERLEAECRDAKGLWLISKECTLHDMHLIGEWVAQMGGPHFVAPANRQNVSSTPRGKRG